MGAGSGDGLMTGAGGLLSDCAADCEVGATAGLAGAVEIAGDGFGGVGLWPAGEAEGGGGWAEVARDGDGRVVGEVDSAAGVGTGSTVGAG